MRHQLTITLEVKSRCTEARIAKQFESLFEFGTIKESIAEGLRLETDPWLLAVAVKSTASDHKLGPTLGLS